MAMELKNVFEQIGGDYEGVIGRLMTEERVIKYLKKFSASQNMELITKPLSEEDYETAFREAHNLKGVCANLGITVLGASASELTEALRGGKPTVDVAPLIEQVAKDFETTVAAFASL